jgi:hypothetical protein
MRKTPLLIFCLFIIFASATLAENKITSVSDSLTETHFSNPFNKIGGWIKHLFIKKKNKPQANNTPANVTGLQVRLPQELSFYLDGQMIDTSGGNILEITTSAVDTYNDTLIYDYTITGGRIIGTGSKVFWDLSDAAPGRYLITAGVDDGCGVCGTTETKQVMVLGSEDSTKVIPCPGALITSNQKSILVGEIAQFRVNFLNINDAEGYQVYWKINSGNIVSGQGSDTLSVVAGWDSSDTGINASLSLGDENIGCQYSVLFNVKVLEP